MLFVITLKIPVIVILEPFIIAQGKLREESQGGAIFPRHQILPFGFAQGKLSSR
ncbi:MAG: hypothetical protein Q8O43_04445 [Dehalococcoidia bacterium]|nr:hypothetical protein [Dehalococcoidia bacterium]